MSGDLRDEDAIQDGNTDLERRDLTVKVAGREALPQWRHMMHPVAGKTVRRTVFSSSSPHFSTLIRVPPLRDATDPARPEAGCSRQGLP